MTPIFQWVWTTSLHAGVLIAIALLIRCLVGRWLPARILFLLGIVIIIRLLMPVVPSSFLSVDNLWKTSPPSPAPVETIQATPPHAVSFPAGVEMVSSRSEIPVAPATKSHFSFVRFLPWGWFAIAAFILSWRLIQHFGLRLEITKAPTVVSPPIRALLEECKSEAGVKRHIRIVTLKRWRTPSIFQFRRPILILPAGLDLSLDSSQLKMIFLHELAHVKRGDVVWNWLVIFVKALHWFNPLVRVAMHQFIADRELVRDEWVLRRLAKEDHAAYGHTLLKLSEGVSGPGLCPSLVPIINHQKQIKRRVIMITKYKPTRIRALMAGVAAIIALSCVTFTKATEKPQTTEGGVGATLDEVPREAEPEEIRNRAILEQDILEIKAELKAVENQKKGLQTRLDTLLEELGISDASELEGPTQTEQEFFEEQEKRSKTIEVLRKALEELNQMVKEAEQEVERLRKKYGIANLMPELGNSGGKDYAEMAKLYRQRLVMAQSQYASLEALLKKLKSYDSREELVQALPTAVSDARLADLMANLDRAHQELASQSVRLTPENPQIKIIQALINKITQQIDDRVDGILAGLDAKATSYKAEIDNLEEKLKEAIQEEARLSQQYLPYETAKRNLENISHMRDFLNLKIQQEELDMRIPRIGVKKE